jgi:hypothetical protein
MSNDLNTKTDPGKPTLYQIRIKGHLDSQWTEWFGGLDITLVDDGDTLLTGPVVDQAALHGLLKKVRDLGIPLLSVIQVQIHETNQYHSKKGIIKMNTIKKATEKIDTKLLLSTLWIVVMINMAFADILGLFIPGSLEEVAKTSVSTGTTISQLMLGGAIMLEIPIAMILLSRVLKYKVNRWANIITSVITILYVVGGGSLYPHYIFMATMEVVCMLLIVWFAWKWRNLEG